MQPFEEAEVALRRVLRLAVAGERRDRRRLGQRQLLVGALAVERAAGGDEDDPADPGRARRLEHVGGAADVDRGVEVGVLDRFAHVDLGGEVEDQLGTRLGEDGADRGVVADVDLGQPGAARERAVEVHPTPGREVVEHGHLVATGEQGVDQIRADESGAAGHESPHQAADPKRIGRRQAWRFRGGAREDGRAALLPSPPDEANSHREEQQREKNRRGPRCAVGRPESGQNLQSPLLHLDRRPKATRKWRSA